jgi:photosystem II stability/assembly factor-like uncharacterized protein
VYVTSKPAMSKQLLLAFLLIFVLCAAARGQSWQALGPPGGDVHSLAVDPVNSARLFLGTADGHIFGSTDYGGSWQLLGRVSDRNDDVVTAMVVDPRDANIVFASAWTQDPSAGGGIYRSNDAGRNWRPAGLAGQAVRALAMAPSEPDTLVAGTLDGLYRTRDAAKSWQRISPEHHAELRNFDAVAIDRRDPAIVYAGTFHLPWKTADGGQNWKPIHQGMIDDSDVMSLLVDASEPGRVYASACSGIYLSADSAEQWKKIQGIPYAARRTYVIAQDSKQPSHVYAATSEGFWKTSDAGISWKRTTPSSWVVNTVVVPEGRAGRVVIGTQQFGILTSDDGGETFREANGGFSHRQILALALDSEKSGRILAVLANAPEPVLATDDDGKSWLPLGPGLRSEQVSRVYSSDKDWWAALLHGGLLRYDSQQKSWQRTGQVTGEAVLPPSSPVSRRAAGTTPSARRAAAHARRPLEQVVHDMAFGSKRWYAATENGLLVSSDRGANWILCPIGPLTTLPVSSVRVSDDGNRLWVVSLRGLVISPDEGKSWQWRDLPIVAGGAVSLDADPGDPKTLAAIARNGLYISRDSGDSWAQAGAGLPNLPVQDLAISGGTYVVSLKSGGLYVSSNSGRTWDRVGGAVADGMFPALMADGREGAIFAASATDGVFAVRWNAARASHVSSTSAPGGENSAP